MGENGRRGKAIIVIRHILLLQRPIRRRGFFERKREKEATVEDEAGRFQASDHDRAEQAKALLQHEVLQEPEEQAAETQLGEHHPPVVVRADPADAAKERAILVFVDGQLDDHEQQQWRRWYSVIGF